MARPSGLAVDREGNVYISLAAVDVVVRLSPDGRVRVVAGNGFRAFSGDDELAVNASLSSPGALAVDADGTLYIADTGNNRVRGVSPEGVIRTIAGTGAFQGFQGGRTGRADETPIGRPRGLAVDSGGDVYISCQAFGSGLGLVYRVSRDGAIRKIAGNVDPNNPSPGTPAEQTRLLNPAGLAIDVVGNLYIAESARISRVTPEGKISIVVGRDERVGFYGDSGPALVADVNGPLGIALDETGNLYIADTNNHRIRRVTLDRLIDTVAGSGPAEAGGGGFGGDGGGASSARLDSPSAVSIDAFGNLLIADSGNHRLRRVNTRGVIETAAGSGSLHEANARSGATLAVGRELRLATDPAGNLYVSDAEQALVFRIRVDGTAERVAGTGKRGFGGDGGQALQADLNRPGHIAADASGNVYFTDQARDFAAVIRRVDARGAISEVARLRGGVARAGALAVTSGGDLYYFGAANQLFRISPETGTSTVVAGDGSAFLSDLNLPIPAAQVSFSTQIISLVADSAGNLYMALDRGIYRLSPDGLISLFALEGLQRRAGPEPCLTGEEVPAKSACV
ncbi:MAG: hypothetical protein HYR60_20615, partial [Acidobacteria bacterium]|nr:hypothetical protein [Acidobacteriota bacterium]